MSFILKENLPFSPSSLSLFIKEFFSIPCIILIEKEILVIRNQLIEDASKLEKIQSFLSSYLPLRFVPTYKVYIMPYYGVHISLFQYVVRRYSGIVIQELKIKVI